MAMQGNFREVEWVMATLWLPCGNSGVCVAVMGSTWKDATFRNCHLDPVTATFILQILPWGMALHEGVTDIQILMPMHSSGK